MYKTHSFICIITMDFITWDCIVKGWGLKWWMPLASEQVNWALNTANLAASFREKCEIHVFHCVSQNVSVWTIIIWESFRFWCTVLCSMQSYFSFHRKSSSNAMRHLYSNKINEYILDCSLFLSMAAYWFFFFFNMHYWTFTL